MKSNLVHVLSVCLEIPLSSFSFKLKYPAYQDFSGHLLRRPKIFEPIMKLPLKSLDNFLC